MSLIPAKLVGKSVVALGTADMGTRRPAEECFSVIGAYLDAGGAFLDTAHCYAAWVPGGEGVSEETVGAYLRLSGARDEIFIATKGGHPGFGSYVRPDRYLSPEILGQDFAQSLERLAMDSVDLYYAHRDAASIPVDEIVDMLAEFVTAGRTTYLGASNWPLARIQAANAYATSVGKPGFSFWQNQWSLGVPSWQETEDPTTRTNSPADALWASENGVALSPFSATSNGFFASGGEAGAGFDSPTNRARLEVADAIADEEGATAGDVAIAYLTNQPGAVFPIIGTLDAARAVEAIAGARLRLSESQLRRLEVLA